jgi:tetratricopeptide (TPR) repeat protein
MAIRKEQVLLLATLLVAFFWWRSADADPRINQKFAPLTKEYVPQSVLQSPLVMTKLDKATLRQWFREPSETQPLPPRDLPFPALLPLFVVALPLELGPDLAHAELLRISGEVVDGVKLQPKADSDGASDGASDAGADAAPAGIAADKPAGGKPAGGKPATAESPATGIRAMAQERWSHVYDQLWLEGQRAPLLGIVTPSVGVDRFDLEDDKFDFAAIKIDFLQFSLTTEKLQQQKSVFDAENRQKVTKVRLAETLKNEVDRRKRKLPNDIGHAAERLVFIDWLLQKGRDAGWAYDVALQQAEDLATQGGGLDALRAKVRVLQARGDLALELEVYKTTTGDGALAAFRHEGLGQMQARLGLWKDAEADLRSAVQAMPSDARTHASLAEFLQKRGRGKEAMEQAQKVIDALGAVVDDEDRKRVITIIISCQLGLGDVAAARTMLGLLRGDTVTYVRACIDYADGALAAAKDGFQQAASGPEGAAAQLGIGATQLRLGAWQEALSTFEAVADQSPLLRHRVFAGIGLLYLRLGQFDAAISWLDRALEANPQYAYAHYLKGRVHRVAGQLSKAEDSLLQTLRFYDDCAPALAEVAELHSTKARAGSAADQPTQALAAMRYTDRAVELSSIPLVALLLRQAIAHFEAADPRGAVAAFERVSVLAIKDKSDDAARQAQAGLCVVDYSQDRSEDALATLDRMIQDLQSNKEHPLRKWAEATRRLIENHAEKEQLEDHFERNELGAIWDGSGSKRDGSLGAAIVDHGIQFQGVFGKSTEVSAARMGAIAKGKNFLASSVRLQFGAEHRQEGTETGLRLQSRIGANGSNDFIVWTGFRDGRPFLYLQDGREDPLQPAIKPTDASPRSAHVIELRVEPRDEAGRSLQLLCIWDGDVVYQCDIKMLNGQTSNELETSLFVKGQKGANADARFDDYHLERRKDL